MHTYLVEALDATGQARVLIALHDPVAINAADAERTSAVAEAQASVLTQLSTDDFKLSRQYTYVPGLAGTITQNGLKILRAHPLVASIQLDMPVVAHLKESVNALSANIVHENFDLTGRGVTVAVLDTGIDTDHPDLSDDIVAQHCFTDGDCPPYDTDESMSAEDEHGHGTNVTSIVTSNGTVSSVGFAPDADIVAVRVLDANGDGRSSDVVAGLDWIRSNLGTLNVDVINMSLGEGTYFGNCDSQQSLLASAVSQLVNRGVVIFAATGNQGQATAINAPACITGVIAVGATYDSGLGREPDSGTYQSWFDIRWPACFDNPTSLHTITCFTNSNAMMDIVAPGSRITASGKDGGTSTYIGTSQASPTAAGIAALLLQENSDLTPADIETRLRTTGIMVTDPKNRLEFPAINALNAIPEELANPFKLIAPEPEEYNRFGRSIATNGNTLVIGASSYNNYTGAVYIFQRDRMSWIQKARLTASDVKEGDFFGRSVAISEDGDTVVVGARGDDEACPSDAPFCSTGAVFIFERGGGWSNGSGNQKAKLIVNDAASDDNFGSSVAISGDTVVAGALGVGDPDQGTGFGAAYIFERGGGWSNGSGNQKAKLAVSDPQNAVFLGQSVAISGDTVVVGTYAVGGLESAVYIFERDGGWSNGSGNQKAKLTPSVSTVGIFFGTSVAISEDGDTVVVGASGGGGWQGSAYIFERPATGWKTTNRENARLTASEPAPYNGFGSSVDISGITVVVGAPNPQGTLYVFERGDNNVWDSGSDDQTAKLRPGEIERGDVFGYSVAISANIVVSGSPGHNDRQGAAYVYDLRGELPTPTAVTLTSFTAQAGSDHVTLTWETASEIDNEGFNLWRSGAADGEYTKINAALIPAQGDADTGASYTYTDADVVRGALYYYQLEDVDMHGVSAFHGPVWAMPGERRVYLPLVLK